MWLIDAAPKSKKIIGYYGIEGMFGVESSEMRKKIWRE
jgi:hypothetical protein